MKKIFFTAIMFSSLVISSQCTPQTRVDFAQLVQEPTTVIIDVRTVEEFSAGHIEQSINIPLQVFPDSIEGLRRFETIILICRTGNRSGQAKTMLDERGFENAHNGGAWDEFQRRYLR
jgi:rhodanese-related sulfurtransferase